MSFIKKQWLPLFILALVILSLVLNYVVQSKSSSEEDVLTNNEQTFCYLYEGVSDVQTPEGEFEINREYITMSVNEHGVTTGQHLILPYGIDTNRASFYGIIIDGFANVVATATAEGMTWQEQRLYKITDDKLYVGYQEVFIPQYQHENGVYMYEDINNINFETEDFYLNKVACDSVDQNILL
ncbi:MAG: hypothetical protein MRY57_03695 [Candidatus Pacebacteria bacterium]|nr:hypothetical protein [Candidatus Paceibacterota bacterium]